MNAQQSAEGGTPRRRRGGQPDNRNARKHGFYASALTPEEQETLRMAIDLKGLNAEIAVLRVKLMELISNPGTSHELLLLAARTLTRMVDIQDRITYGR